MSQTKLKKIIIEPEAVNRPMTRRILEKTAMLNLERLEIDSSAAIEAVENTNFEKQTLRLCDFPGRILKPCPGTSNYICCGYQILQIGTNCPLNCSYCILQAYLNNPDLRIFVNIPERINEVFTFIEQNPESIFRIGTGEFTDSLALDRITGWSDWLVPSITRYKNIVLELKTKSNEITGLLKIKQRERIVISWSLNSPLITSREEKGASSIKKRLKAAQQCQREGFIIGLHFDPLIEHAGWQEQYLQTITMLDHYLDPKKIIWLSLGCFRYMPDLKEIIRRLHPDSHILDGEFVLGLDKKMRYFKPIRIDLYAYLYEILTKWYDNLGVYLCMESDEIWKKALGWSPRHSEGLAKYLDDRVDKFFS